MHKGGQLGWLQREGGINTTIGTREGEMLLDHTGAESHRRNRNTHAHGVIREAHLAAKQFAQVGDSADIRIVRGGWIGTGALEKDKIPATRLTGSSHGTVQIRQGCHAG